MRKSRGENVDMSSLRYVDGFSSYDRVFILFLYLSHPRTGIAAGSPVPIDLMKRLISKLNLKDLTNAYGMSGLVFWTTFF
jgi:hypothetical protein